MRRWSALQRAAEAVKHAHKYRSVMKSVHQGDQHTQQLHAQLNQNITPVITSYQAAAAPAPRHLTGLLGTEQDSRKEIENVDKAQVTMQEAKTAEVEVGRQILIHETAANATNAAAAIALENSRIFLQKETEGEAVDAPSCRPQFKNEQDALGESLHLAMHRHNKMEEGGKAILQRVEITGAELVIAKEECRIRESAAQAALLTVAASSQHFKQAQEDRSKEVQSTDVNAKYMVKKEADVVAGEGNQRDIEADADMAAPGDCFWLQQPNQSDVDKSQAKDSQFTAAPSKILKAEALVKTGDTNSSQNERVTVADTALEGMRRKLQGSSFQRQEHKVALATEQGDDNHAGVQAVITLMSNVFSPSTSFLRSSPKAALVPTTPKVTSAHTETEISETMLETWASSLSGTKVVGGAATVMAENASTIASEQSSIIISGPDSYAPLQPPSRSSSPCLVHCDTHSPSSIVAEEGSILKTLSAMPRMAEVEQQPARHEIGAVLTKKEHQQSEAAHVYHSEDETFISIKIFINWRTFAHDARSQRNICRYIKHRQSRKVVPTCRLRA